MPVSAFEYADHENIIEILNDLIIGKHRFRIMDSVDETKLKNFHKNGNITSCILEIKRMMGLTENRVNISFVPDKLLRPAAYVSIPSNLPLFLSPKFKDFVIPISIKESLKKNYDTLVYCVAHEFSHVVLHSLNSIWKVSEMSTDLFVMIQGFVTVMERGRKIKNSNGTTEYGYLNDSNFQFAKSHLNDLKDNKITIVKDEEPSVTPIKPKDSLPKMTKEEIESARLKLFGDEYSKTDEVQYTSMTKEEIEAAHKRLFENENKKECQPIIAGSDDVIHIDDDLFLSARERRLKAQRAELAAGMNNTPAVESILIPFSSGNFFEGNEKWGYRTKDNKIVVDCIYCNADDFSEGLAAVQAYVEGNEGKWGYINNEGKRVIPCKYDKCDKFSEGLAAVGITYSIGGSHFDEWWDEWVFINKDGNQTIEKTFKGAKSFSQGLAPVMIELNHLVDNLLLYGGQWGYIDKNGDTKIPFNYDEACSFADNLAAVKKNDKWGYINRDNIVVIPFEYLEALPFSENRKGLAIVQLENKWGYIDVYNYCESGFIYDDLIDLLSS